MREKTEKSDYFPLPDRKKKVFLGLGMNLPTKDESVQLLALSDDISEVQAPVTQLCGTSLLEIAIALSDEAAATALLTT